MALLARRRLADGHEVDVPTDRPRDRRCGEEWPEVSATARARSVPSFAELPPGRELLAVPVQMSGQVVAVLYADQGTTQSAGNLLWPMSLELMARHAARCLEAITAYRAAQVLTERPELPAVNDAATESRRVGDAGDEVGKRGRRRPGARRYARLLISEISCSRAGGARRRRDRDHRHASCARSRAPRSLRTARPGGRARRHRLLPRRAVRTLPMATPPASPQELAFTATG